jgi:phosphate-selective porin OprO/OprP
MNRLSSSRRFFTVTLFTTLFSPPATLPAGTTRPAVERSAPALSEAVEPAGLDRVWSLATLYQDDRNPIVQELKLRGRYHGQYHWLESDQGEDDGWEDRRSRLGIDAKLFHKRLEVRLDAQSSDGFEPIYDRLVDAYLKWKPTADFSLTLGRQKPQLGHYDWLQSTNAQPTCERSQVFNQLRVDRATGAVAEGRTGRFTYQAGVYANDVDREFGRWEGGISFGTGAGWDFKDSIEADRADLRLHWLHSRHEEGDTVLNRYDDLVSATFWWERGPAGFVAEAFAGTGAEPDVFGFFLQPVYDLVPDTLQLVGRYSFTRGDGPDSVIAQGRYERSAPGLTGGGRGESYQSGYLGLQYFLHGDRLKFLVGAEYSRVDGGGNGGDYAGWTVLSGVRFSF